MKTLLRIQEGKLVVAPKEEATIRLFSAPDDAERTELVESLGIDPYDVDSALDPDEISRVEINPKHIAIIWKVPYKGVQDDAGFDVTSMGLFLGNGNELTIVTNESPESLLKEGFRSMNSLNGFVLRYFAFTTRQFLRHLKAIKQATAHLETQIGASMTNQALLKMFDLSERLVYYVNAIEANGAALEKLRSRTERFQLTDRQIGFIEDIILENKQAARQADIYTSLLTGLMDARGSIINNNMNVLLKNLTIINVVFLPLSILAGMGGMSEFTAITDEYGIDWRIGYPLFTLVLTVLGFIIWMGITKYIDRQSNGKRRP